MEPATTALKGPLGYMAAAQLPHSPEANRTRDSHRDSSSPRGRLAGLRSAPRRALLGRCRAVGPARVETACRDCKKCMNSGVANLGRNTTRASVAVATAGLSEVGMKFRKTCRLCGHQLSLHSGDGEPRQAAAPQPWPTPTCSGPPPGWYSDPHRLAPSRWWDGQRWTEHTRSSPPD